MEFTLVGIGGIAALLSLLLLGVELAICFFLVSFVGIALLLTPGAAFSLMGETLYSAVASPNYTVLPLFILMGAFSAASGFAEKAYNAIHTFAARVPGSLAIATAFGSAAFGTVCGSSLATASVFGRIAYPQMRRLGYDRGFALGSIACSGTFASMIPPSGMFILLAIFTDTSVGKLFMAGVIPGVLTAVVYAVSMYLRVRLNPSLAPFSEREHQVTLVQRLSGLKDLWQITLLGGIVIGGLYAGFFTPTEAGAVGAFGALIFGLALGPLRRYTILRQALQESAHTTATLFIIIIGALFFSRFLGLTRIPFDLSIFLETWDVHPHFVLLLILATWFVLGMFIVQAAVFAFTLPILFPVVVNLGYDPIWFCVVALKMNEIAAVSPPVGLNAFSLAGAAGDDVRVDHVYRGVFPFILCDIGVLILLFLVPQIATFLPNTMFN